MEAVASPRPGLVRRLYDWVLGFADSRHATTALAVLAFTESSFFPIPPDVLLIALCLGVPTRSFRYALVCAIASVLGGIAGYAIGYAAEPVGRAIIVTLANAETFEKVAGYYGENAFVYILAAAFTPIPYKVFTIAAGMFHEAVPLSTLVLASAIGRSGRFFLVAALIWKFGPRVKGFIDRYFNLITIAALLLFVGGFLAIKYVGHGPLDPEVIERALNDDDPKIRRLRAESLEKEAKVAFGFDPEHKASAPENADAWRRIQEWLEAQE